MAIYKPQNKRKIIRQKFKSTSMFPPHATKYSSDECQSLVPNFYTHVRQYYVDVVPSIDSCFLYILRWRYIDIIEDYYVYAVQQSIFFFFFFTINNLISQIMKYEADNKRRSDGHGQLKIRLTYMPQVSMCTTSELNRFIQIISNNNKLYRLG